jgi:hypothetical protein
MGGSRFAGQVAGKYESTRRAVGGEINTAHPFMGRSATEPTEAASSFVRGIEQEPQSSFVGGDSAQRGQ